MAGPAGLERDFGYLMPFLDKVAAAAQQVADPASRAELQRLVADEKQRWTRIRQLLGSAGVAAGPAPAGGAKAGAAERAPGASLTVGSLRRG